MDPVFTDFDGETVRGGAFPGGRQAYINVVYIHATQNLYHRK
jgi:hypothetical protein